MPALHQAGRTADALEHHRLLRERLVEELGADAGMALRDLHRLNRPSEPQPADSGHGRQVRATSIP
ncbi:MAG: BTAD domain-containing putative transcriptional regulator [Umezawaea sp.]